MFGFFMFLGLAIVFISLIALIVFALKRKKKRKILISMACGAVLFIIGIINTPSVSPTENSGDKSKEVGNEDNKNVAESSEIDEKALIEKSANYVKVLNDALKKEEVIYDKIRKESDGSLTAVYKTSSNATFQVLFDSDMNFTGVSSNQNGDTDDDKYIFTNLCAISARIPDFGITEITNEISMSLSGSSEKKVDLEKCSMVYIDSMKYLIITLK